MDLSPNAYLTQLSNFKNNKKNYLKKMLTVICKMQSVKISQFNITPVNSAIKLYSKATDTIAISSLACISPWNAIGHWLNFLFQANIKM